MAIYDKNKIKKVGKPKFAVRKMFCVLLQPNMNPIKKYTYIFQNCIGAPVLSSANNVSDLANYFVSIFVHTNVHKVFLYLSI